ncbi:MAG: Valine--tRNA ligase [Chlamydiae bacterium]|nr:Valine--tRNA ligase [Chlamydiota bacterium]
MEEEIETVYDAKKAEEKWLSFWEEKGFFRADAGSDKPPYCIVIPPPNVTGVLHMGHALVNILQDILIRWKRMCGYEALWVPGTDHAGIATQTVVERHLFASEGKRRTDYDREEFLGKVWAWKEKSEKTILEQLKRMGSSCDFSRLRFTMDEGCNQAVRTMFHKLYEAGYIYRGDYLVNWDPVTQTALADDEVEYEERSSYLYYFRYHLVGSGEYLTIATTRPETMLGDTALAVHPKDPRFASLIGKKVRLPIMEREIPIIGDQHVDPEFGTGVVKITPAHDPNDYRMGLEHNLPMINILTPDGHINENGGPFKGMGREEAREAVVLQMERLGLFEKKVRHTHRVGLSYRSKAVIEPYLSKQWFIKMAPFKEKLLAAVREERVKIIPKTWENTYFHWVENLRDWCISRQLWWGHRIPVWYAKDDPDKILCHAGLGEPEEVKNEPDRWIQDPDVLDTWFSSALWPMSTLGWPEKTPDFQKFYPNSVLVTGHDILFFWVARMIMMGEYETGQAPFKETFLHGLIYGKSYWHAEKGGGISYITGDEKKSYDLGKPLPKGVFSKWEKLSKSKGNVIDPLEMIEDYGTDAIRMSLCSCANQSPQIDLDRRRFDEFRNFANKIWNGARFVLLNLEGLTSDELSEGLDESILALEDRWLLSSLNRVHEEANAFLSSYSFDQAAALSYNFFWKGFCANYLEIAKPILFGKVGTEKEKKNKQKLLVIALDHLLRLLHPIAPFITEELFQRIKSRFPDVSQTASDPYTKATLVALSAPACTVAPYPQVIRKSDRLPEIEREFALVEEVVYAVRNLRGEMKIPPQTATEVYLVGDFPEEVLSILSALVRVKKIHLTKTPPTLGFSASKQKGSLKIVIPLPEEMTIREKVRLAKEEEKLIQTMERLEKLLANPDFLAKADPVLVAKQQAALTSAKSELHDNKQKQASLT